MASSALGETLPRSFFTSERSEKFAAIDAFAAAERMEPLVDLLPEFLDMEQPDLVFFLICVHSRPFAAKFFQ